MADDGQELTLSSDMGMADLQTRIMDAHNVTPSKISELQTQDSTLFDLVQGEVLPRLMLLHRGAVRPKKLKSGKTKANYEAAVEELAHLLCQPSGRPAAAFVEGLFEGGGDPVDVFLDVLSPAAKKLGRFWEHDLCTFTDVTVGLIRLQSILRHYEIASERNYRQPTTEAPSALLATLESDQHMFGLLMVSDLFRRDGWQVSCEPAAPTSTLIDAVTKTKIDVLGLSLATAVDVPDLKRDITKIRDASANQSLQIVIGGSLVLDKPDFAKSIGADLLLTSAETAATRTRQLLARVPDRC